jgi:hypothetical protein
MSSLLIKSDAEFQRRFQPRSTTDWLIDGLTPIMIFFMVSSVVYFLLDVRFVYTEEHYGNLRFVTLCFITGVVALNRLIAQDNTNESPIYFAVFAGTIVLYTFATVKGFGIRSGAGGIFDSPGWATTISLAVFSFIWWVTHRLTHECCVDTDPFAGDVGILTGTARRLQKAIKGRNDPEAEPMFQGLFARKAGPLFPEVNVVPVDPTEYDPNMRKKKIIIEDAASKRPPKRHPGISIFYFSVPVMIIFALGLPVLLQGGEAMVLYGYLYLCIYTFSALSLLMLSSLGGLREYFRARRVHIPAGIGPFWIGLGTAFIVIVMVGAIRLPKPELPQMAVVTQHQTDFFNPGSTFRLQSTMSTPAQILTQSRIAEYVSTGVLVCLGLFFMYAGLRGIGFLAITIASDRRRYPPWVSRFFDRVDAFLAKVLTVPSMPKFVRTRRVSKDVSRSIQYRSPLGTTEATGDARSREVIETSYQALCALAEDMGVPRGPGETPYEFIHRFPRKYRGLKEEAVLLTDLYVLSAYSPAKLDEKTLDQVRKFWMTYEKVRNVVVQ